MTHHRRDDVEPHHHLNKTNKRVSEIFQSFIQHNNANLLIIKYFVPCTKEQQQQRRPFVYEFVPLLLRSTCCMYYRVLFYEYKLFLIFIFPSSFIILLEQNTITHHGRIGGCRSTHTCHQHPVLLYYVQQQLQLQQQQ